MSEIKKIIKIRRGSQQHMIWSPSLIALFLIIYNLEMTRVYGP